MSAPPTLRPAASGSALTASSELVRELYPQTLDCVHCGLCLSSCPTYRITGRETASPRGRVYLMRGVAEGRIPVGEVVAEEAFLCLGCRACETACPSGVQYGALLERTREAVERVGLRQGFAPRLERLALRRIVPRPRTLALAVTALGWIQGLRLDRVAGLLLRGRLREMLALLPAIPPASERRRLPARLPARGTQRGRVAFFEGCIMPELFGAVNRTTVELLAGQGFEVVVPPAQSCCGALQAHAGDRETAQALARTNLDAFAAEDFDALIVNSAGCGAALREQEHWLGRAAEPLAARVRDVCEFLDEVGLRGELGPVPLRVAYDDPCHLVHAQGVAAAPRRLLRAVPELELVEHDDATACCGAAGIYNLTHPGMSREVLDRKLDALEAVAPDAVATGNPGCLMQLRAGAAMRGHGWEIVHPMELLARSLR